MSFFALKDRDPLIRYCYSFGNDGRSYCYSRDIEPLKRAAHRAVVDGDCSLLPAAIREPVSEALGDVIGTYEHYLCYKRITQELVGRFGLPHISRYARALGIVALRQIARRYVCTRKDYRDLYIPDGAVVYCDPPYASTTGYGGGFDHRAFYAWCGAVGKSHPLFVSEYWMPPDFRCVAEFTVRALAGAKTNAQTRVEKIFTL